MKFHIVTPCTGASAALTATADSITAQTALGCGEHSISHIVQTNTSTLADFPPSLTEGPLRRTVRQAEDTGLYDALRRGFVAAPSDTDVFCYLGAGDRLSPHACEIVAGIMGANRDVQWLTGLICGYNDQGHMTEAQVPFCYRERLIRAGAYGAGLPYIQQESTFWSTALHAHLDWDAISLQRLAGDALMWHQLSHHAPLHIVEAWLGGFERRAGQLSVAHASEYAAELARLSESPTLADRALIAWDWLLWHSPRAVKRAFAPARFIYDEQRGDYVRR